MAWIETTSEGARLRLRVLPRAGKDAVQGLHGDRLKVRLQAPPVDGKANKALLKFLARALGLPASRLALVSGETGREKTLLVRGVSPEKVAETLGLPGL
jgi:uncharacterized protein (TIGR00251 family)